MKKKIRGKNGGGQSKGAPSLAASSLIPGISSTAAVFIIAAIAFIAFLLYVVTQPVPPAVSTSYSDPLIPVTAPKIAVGEKYVYEWVDPQLGNVEVNNEVRSKSGGCFFVYTESKNMSLPFCLDERTGEPIDPSGSGESLNVSPQFFQPWMLALRENWTWRTGLNTTVDWMGAQETIESSSTYRVAGIGSAKGRVAFKVIIEASVRRASGGREYPAENGTQVVWVDFEKRVLLYAAAGAGHIELIRAPFNVTPYSEPK